MVATSALIDVNTIVDRYLLKYKKTTEDSFIYLEHACNCIRDFHLYDSPDLVTEKVSISALGIIEMPTSMVGFNKLYKFTDGVKWSFTQRDDVITTTTTTLGVEGQDSTYGEGSALKDPKSDTYGGVGGVNDYYYKPDWKARRIFVEGLISDTVMLEYTTSGVEVSGVTYVPEFITPMIDNYLLEKETFWMPELARERDSRAKNYTNAENRIRNLINAMGYDEWRDLLNSITTMAPLR